MIIKTRYRLPEKSVNTLQNCSFTRVQEGVTMSSHNNINFGAISGHHPVHVKSAMTQDDNDLDATGLQPRGLGVDRLDFVQEPQFSGV